MKKVEEGFTLIELMIVTAIIAIIAAIAIPSLLRSRISANETSAVGSLRNLTTAQGAWRQGDLDGNGKSDYWTVDVYGLSQCADGAGNPMKVIDVAIGKSDRFPSAVPGAAAPRPYYVAVAPAAPVAKSGYVLEALVNDETGAPYAQDGGDADAKACENTARFGFLAMPEVYASTGVSVYQVNEAGVIYGRDAATGASTAPPQANWEGGADPSSAAPAWRVVN